MCAAQLSVDKFLLRVVFLPSLTVPVICYECNYTAKVY
jgi:hypothetical protein